MMHQIQLEIFKEKQRCINKISKIKFKSKGLGKNA